MRAQATAMVVGALLLTTVPTAGRATPLDDGPSMVVVGKGPAVATFTLRSEIQFDPSTAVITMGAAATYGGVFFTSVKHDRIYGAAYRVKALEAYEDPDVPAVSSRRAYSIPPPGGPDGVMPAGVYRVYLLGDGEVEVRIPLNRGASFTVRPTAPSRQRVKVIEHVVATDSDDEVESVTLQQGFTRPNRAWSNVVGKVTGPGVLTGSTIRGCFTTKVAKCNHGVYYGRRDVLMLNGSTAVSTSIVRGYTRSTAGRYYATVDLTSEQSVRATLWLAYLQVDY